MLNEIILAIIQAATEFLPISSSGHLALASNILNEPNLFLITTLHLASLLAVLIFTRKEIWSLLKFEKETRMWWIYLILATIPAAAFGYLFKNKIESTFSSYLIIGIAFIFTSIIIFMTRFPKMSTKKISVKNSFLMGLMQILALFPGISRSGMTISTGMFLGVKKETAAKFSFLLFIPLALGAFILNFGDAYYSTSLLVAFIICLVLSLIFLNLLMWIINKGKFWWFSAYTFVLGIFSLWLYFR